MVHPDEPLMVVTLRDAWIMMSLFAELPHSAVLATIQKISREQDVPEADLIDWLDATMEKFKALIHVQASELRRADLKLVPREKE
jgi:hypothetical protein